MDSFQTGSYVSQASRRSPASRSERSISVACPLCSSAVSSRCGTGHGARAARGPVVTGAIQRASFDSKLLCSCGWTRVMMVRAGGILKLAVLVSAFLFAVFLTFQLLETNMEFDLSSIISRSQPVNDVSAKPGVVRYKCGLSKLCPPKHFSFKMASGAASVVGPKICLEDKILMSSVKNNVGRGINIALVDAKTGEGTRTASFDMWAGDVAPFIKFLNEIEDGTIVMIASFDDTATKLNVEARKLIADLGSSEIDNLGFRDNWIFVGGKGIKTKSPFEQHIKNNAETNKFEGWPEVLEMEGCIPQRLD